MELTLNLEYEQIMGLVKQLPANQIAKLKAELDDSYLEVKSEAEIQEFRALLLQGPVMSDEQYMMFKKNRTKFNLWRQK